MACQGPKRLPRDYAYVSLSALPNCTVDTHGNGYGGILLGSVQHRVSFETTTIELCPDCGNPLVIVQVHEVEVAPASNTDADDDGDADEMRLAYVPVRFAGAMEAQLQLDTVVMRPTALDQLYSGLQDSLATLYSELGGHQVGRYTPDPDTVRRTAAAVASWACRLSTATDRMAAEDEEQQQQQQKGW